MTPERLRILQAIAAHYAEHGCCPSYTEIAKAVGLLSLATVYKHIQALLAGGYIVQGESSSWSGNAQRRSIQITPKARNLYKTCPLCGGHIEPAIPNQVP